MMRNRLYLLLSLIGFSITLIISTTNSVADICSKWDKAKKIGVLDTNLIDEASGMQASLIYPGRLYHINDSGGGQYFYVTDTKGDLTKKIKIEGDGIKKSDFEALAVGRCGEDSCLIVGDIGDNKSDKKYVEIIVIHELEQYQQSVKPLRRIKLKYPDQPHNAEGMAVHPNGDLYIITKEENLREYEAYPAKVFKLPAKDWQKPGNAEYKLTYVGEIDLTVINPEGTAYGQVISSFDISPDGRSFLVLTYENAIEFNIDLSKNGIKPTSELKDSKDYKIIEIMPLPQQESISYTPDGKSFLYNTEYHWFEAPILKVDCLD